ncbi:DUF5675 family protein [Paremcibacter congregatus]|uniref:DUF5675 family protein n=1 Tax=Paremcibacter congregatus TaxID=2043170 RepID=UPI003A937AFD
MKITVTRFVSDNDSTISLIMVDGVFVCFGLEDEYRAAKVAGETRIPAGEYKVGVRNVGGFDARYATKFADIHDGMLHILDVPGFEYILIHVGNTDEDTAGCLLVGELADPAPGKMMVGRSVAAYRTFYPMVIKAARAGNLSIEIVDLDRGA